MGPINVKIVPHTLTKKAIEKEMIPVFSDLQMAEDTGDPILYMSMPSLDHVLTI